MKKRAYATRSEASRCSPPSPTPPRATPADLVDRQFRAAAPNRLWVADITCVRTWQGFCYTGFVTAACTRQIVG